MATGIRRGYVRLPTGLVHLRYGGRGSPLVVLHDAGQSSAACERHGLLGHLATRFRVYAPDFPGHGLSDPLPGAPSLEALGAVVLAVADELGDRAVRLLGVGLGAVVTAHLAAAASETVVAGVAAFPPVETAVVGQFAPDSQDLQQRFDRWADKLGEFPEGLPEATALTLDEATAGERGVRAAALRSATVLTRLLSSVKVPMLLVATLGDPQFDLLSDVAASNPALDLALAPAGPLCGAFDPAPFLRMVEDVF